MKLLVSIIAAIVLLMPTNTYAAPLPQCLPGAVTQFDLAGHYASTTINLDIYPCGGVFVEWTNAYGYHFGTYETTGRLTGGGITMYGRLVNPGAQLLDNAWKSGVKPAESGFVQLMTLNELDQFAVYRLRKIY